MAQETRAEVVSITSLAKAIDQAVAIAVKRQDVKVERDTLAMNWEIIGRQLLAVKDFNVAMNVATDITKAVKVKGIKGQPVVSKFGKGVLVGFIDKGLIPRNFG